MKRLISFFAILLALSLACNIVQIPTQTGQPSVPTTAAANPVISTPAANSNPNIIPPSFFAMTTVDGADYPKLQFGTLAHPEIGAWAWIEKTKGTYDFSLFDRYVSEAAAHGLVDGTNTVSMAITLGFTPSWAATDPKSCKTRRSMTYCTSGPADIQDWSNFVTALMKHYNGVSMPHVRYYEVWNEMNINLFWTGTQAEMLSLAKAAYPIVHSDPHSILLTPSVVGPACGTAMTSYLEAGGAQYADGGAFHGYIIEQNSKQYPMPDEAPPDCKGASGCYGPLVTKVNMMRQVFDQHGLAGKPMFDTEGSWGSGTITDPDTQTAWLARWYLLQAGLRSPDNLQSAAWFTWGNPSTFHWGTIETDDKAPTQAGIAYNQVYKWLVGATMSKPCSPTSDGTWTCSLTRGESYNALVIWNNQGSKNHTTATTYADYRDLAGNTVKLTKGATVPIDEKPILLETEPMP